MASAIQMKTLLESGVHFGHQTRRWDPRMKPFIFTERNGIHIIDLQQTVRRLDEAMSFVRQLAADGKVLLFVGTKKQAQDTVNEEASRVNMPFVNQRWMGGMLTNFATIQGRIQRMTELEARQQRGEFGYLPKNEAAKLEDQLAKLRRLFGGVRDLHRLPDAIFVIDPHRERNAVQEARRLEIPIVAMVDTNCNPNEIAYPVPSNDDAIRAIRLLTSKIADAVAEGRQTREVATAEPVSEVEVEAEFVEDELEKPVLDTAALAEIEQEMLAAAEVGQGDEAERLTLTGAEEQEPDEFEDLAVLAPSIVPPDPAKLRSRRRTRKASSPDSAEFDDNS